MPPEDEPEDEHGECAAEIHRLQAEVDRLNALINNPHTDDFIESVKLEAAHQRERWGDAHDAQKSDADFYWLIGWLLGKAVRYETEEKRLHHIITACAACMNWHRRAKDAKAPLVGSNS